MSKCFAKQQQNDNDRIETPPTFAETVWNSFVGEGCEEESSNEPSYLGGLMDGLTESDANDDLTDLFEPLGAIGGAASIFGVGAASDFEAPTLRSGTPSHDGPEEKKGPVAGKTEVGGSLKDGVLGASVQRPYKIGGLEFTGGLISNTDGVMGVAAGVKVAGRDLGVSGQASVDTNEDLAFQGLAGSATLTAGPMDITVGAGVRDAISDVTKRDDGTFIVSWQQGVGAKVGGEGKGKGNDKAGVGAKAEKGRTLTRTFHSEKEAQAFQEKLETERETPEFLIADVEALDVGEKLTFASGPEVGVELSGVAVAPVNGSLGVARPTSIEVTKRSDGKVVAKQSSQAALTGGIGAGNSPLGEKGETTFAHTTAGEIEFDLTVDGAAEALLAYQKTGLPPEEQTPGVFVEDHDNVYSLMNTSSAWALAAQADNEWGVEWGTHTEGDKSSPIARGIHNESDKVYVPGIGTVLSSSKESHKIDLVNEEGEVHPTSVSHYEGQGACAQVHDDFASDHGIEDARSMYGNQACEVTATTDFGIDALQNWMDGARANLAHDEEKAMRVDETPMFRGFKELRSGLAAGMDLHAVASYVAETGGEGLEMLRNNTEGAQTKFEVPGNGLHDNANYSGQVDSEIARLAAEAEAGIMDESDRKAMVGEVFLYLEQIRANREGVPDSVFEQAQDATLERLQLLDTLREQ